jgi:hypothetical protein
MNHRVLYVIAFCPVCETGPVGVRICGRCGAAVAVCEECDAVWLTPDVKACPRFDDDPDLPCPHCSFGLWDPPSHWANFAELESHGWQRHIREVGRAWGDETIGDELGN